MAAQGHSPQPREGVRVQVALFALVALLVMDLLSPSLTVLRCNGHKSPIKQTSLSPHKEIKTMGH